MLTVWEKSYMLALAVYRTTDDSARAETYGLMEQMRRFHDSVPANIADDCGCEATSELGRLLQIATGSTSEVEYQLHLGSVRVLAARKIEVRKSQCSNHRSQVHASDPHQEALC